MTDAILRDVLVCAGAVGAAFGLLAALVVCWLNRRCIVEPMVDHLGDEVCSISDDVDELRGALKAEQQERKTLAGVLDAETASRKCDKLFSHVRLSALEADMLAHKHPAPCGEKPAEPKKKGTKRTPAQLKAFAEKIRRS